MTVTRKYPVLLAAGLFLFGCGISDANDTDDVDFDAAVVAADGTLEDLEVMHGPRLGMRGGVFPGLIGGRPDCPKTQGIFLCDPIEREGVTYTRTIVYKDAAGNTQDGYDEATTASIEYQISVEGGRERTGWSATVARTRNLVVTGLLDGVGEVTWNGDGTADITRSRHREDGNERSHDRSNSINSKESCYTHRCGIDRRNPLAPGVPLVPS